MQNALARISVEQIVDLPANLKGVRVHATNNGVEARLGKVVRALEERA